MTWCLTISIHNLRHATQPCQAQPTCKEGSQYTHTHTHTHRSVQVHHIACSLTTHFPIWKTGARKEAQLSVQVHHTACSLTTHFPIWQTGQERKHNWFYNTAFMSHINSSLQYCLSVTYQLFSTILPFCHISTLLYNTAFLSHINSSLQYCVSVTYQLFSFHPFILFAFREAERFLFKQTLHTHNVFLFRCQKPTVHRSYS